LLLLLSFLVIDYPGCDRLARSSVLSITTPPLMVIYLNCPTLSIRSVYFFRLLASHAVVYALSVIHACLGCRISFIFADLAFLL